MLSRCWKRLGSFPHDEGAVVRVHQPLESPSVMLIDIHCWVSFAKSLNLLVCLIFALLTKV